MTTYAQRLARRTRNTFAPAKRFFQKVDAEAPKFFKKAGAETQNFFTKTLPTVGRKVGNTLEQVGGAVLKSPITEAGLVAIGQPELAAGLAAANLTNQQVADKIRKVGNIGNNLSGDKNLAQQQLVDRANDIGSKLIRPSVLQKAKPADDSTPAVQFA